jgi:hypothetical protein
LPLSSEDLAERLDGISQLPLEEKQRRFIACRQSARERYDVRQMVQRYLELMNKMYEDSL